MTPAEAFSPGFFGPRTPFTAASTKIRVPELPPELLAAHRGSGVTPELVEKALKKPTPKQRLVHRATMGWTPAEQAAVQEHGYYGYLDRQLDYESIDDSPLEEALHEALPSLTMTPFELLVNYAENEPQAPAIELLLATLFRSVYSPRQLFERMVVFWTDHFNIDLFSDFAFFLKPIDDRDVIRRHALGTFPDLLRASGKSPAMLVYLTNDSNVKAHPNENYSRELMELHTLGADRGYTQEDVKEVARALTGWTVKGRDFGRDIGQFFFNRREHDNGAKTVLGEALPAGGGLADGERVFDILAAHPNTADFVARKMLRYMWGYEPQQGKVNKVAKIYLDTGGDIRAMLREVLKRPWMSTATPKLKRPYHHLVSTVRALGAEIQRPGYLLDYLHVAGQLPFTWPPPNGFPDSEGYWSGYVLPRWNFAAEFLHGPVTPSVAGLDPSADAGLTPGKVMNRLNQQLMGGKMSAPTKSALRDFLRAGPLTRQSVAEAVGLAVASPDYQYY